MHARDEWKSIACIDRLPWQTTIRNRRTGAGKTIGKMPQMNNNRRRRAVRAAATGRVYKGRIKELLANFTYHNPRGLKRRGGWKADAVTDGKTAVGSRPGVSVRLPRGKKDADDERSRAMILARRQCVAEAFCRRAPSRIVNFRGTLVWFFISVLLRRAGPPVKMTFNTLLNKLSRPISRELFAKVRSPVILSKDMIRDTETFPDDSADVSLVAAGFKPRIEVGMKLGYYFLPPVRDRAWT